MILIKGYIPMYISVYDRKTTDDLKKSIMYEFLKQKLKSISSGKIDEDDFIKRN